MAEKALAHHYFRKDDCPVHLTRINYRQHQSHAYDLTEREHYHDFVELVFILNGQAVQMLEGNEYKVSAGDVFVLQGYQRHYFRDARNVEIINLMFNAMDDSAVITPELQQMEGFKALFILEPRFRSTHKYKNMLHLTRDELATVEMTLNTMFVEQEQQKEGYKTILVNRFTELIILLSRFYSGIKTTKARALMRISKVIDFMENNFAQDIQLDELATMAHMSKRNFMRTFSGAVGQSPINYLKQIRLQNASKLIRQSDQLIEEISLQCGFTNSNYFIRCFRQTYGITPNKFRGGLR